MKTGNPYFQSTRNTRLLPGSDGRYLRSDVPLIVTEQEARRLLEQGITTLVDLRTPSERLARPCPLEPDIRFRFLALPVSGGNQIPCCPAAVPASYLKMVDRQMDNILAQIQGAPGGVLFFCTAGKDRTGVVSALLLRSLGASHQQIIEDYLLSAQNLKDVLAEYARQNPKINLETIMPKAEYMEIFLLGLPRAGK